MAMNVTYLGHSGFLLQSGPYVLAIDPFLTGNPAASCKAEDIRCTHVALTHGHEDHFGDTVEIAHRSGAVVMGAYELVMAASKLGVAKIEPMNPGGAHCHAFWLGCVDASLSLLEPWRPVHGYANGCSGEPGWKSFYHTGDTSLFSDMKLIGEIYKPDIAFICAGDRFTMGPELASRAAEFIGAPTAVPMHWGTWPLLAQEQEIRQKFVPRGITVRVMKPGDSLAV